MIFLIFIYLWGIVSILFSIICIKLILHSILDQLRNYYEAEVRYFLPYIHKLCMGKEFILLIKMFSVGYNW